MGVCIGICVYGCVGVSVFYVCWTGGVYMCACVVFTDTCICIMVCVHTWCMCVVYWVCVL